MPEDGVRILKAQMLLGTLANMRSLFATLQPKKKCISLKFWHLCETEIEN